MATSSKILGGVLSILSALTGTLLAQDQNAGGISLELEERYVRAGESIEFEIENGTKSPILLGRDQNDGAIPRFSLTREPHNSWPVTNRVLVWGNPLESLETAAKQSTIPADDDRTFVLSGGMDPRLNLTPGLYTLHVRGKRLDAGTLFVLEKSFFIFPKEERELPGGAGWLSSNRTYVPGQAASLTIMNPTGGRLYMLPYLELHDRGSTVTHLFIKGYEDSKKGDRFTLGKYATFTVDMSQMEGWAPDGVKRSFDALRPGTYGIRAWRTRNGGMQLLDEVMIEILPKHRESVFVRTTCPEVRPNGRVDIRVYNGSRRSALKLTGLTIRPLGNETTSPLADWIVPSIDGTVITADGGAYRLSVRVGDIVAATGATALHVDYEIIVTAEQNIRNACDSKGSTITVTDTFRVSPVADIDCGD